jgi:hypothetical protein
VPATGKQKLARRRDNRAVYIGAERIALAE